MTRLMSTEESERLDVDGLRVECTRLREVAEGCAAETEVLSQFLSREGYDVEAILTHSSRPRVVSTNRVPDWPTVEVPVPDLLGEPITADQMREVFHATGLGLDDGTALGDWLGSVCDAVEATERPWRHDRT